MLRNKLGFEMTLATNFWGMYVVIATSTSDTRRRHGLHGTICKLSTVR